MDGASDWSVTSHTGLWLADVVPMYHWTMWTCTSHYPASLWLRRSISLSCPTRVLNSEHADCIHRYRLGTDRGCGDGGYVGFTISLLLPPGRNRLGLTEKLGKALFVELKTQCWILSILSGWVNSCIKQESFKTPPPSYQAWLVIPFPTGAPPPVCLVSCHISLDVSLISCSPLPLRSELAHVCHPVILSALSVISFLLSSHSDLHWITRQDDKHHSVTQDIKILLKCIKW